MQTRRYKGKVAAWWWILVGGLAVLFLWYAVQVAMGGIEAPPAVHAAMLVPLGVCLALLAWITAVNWVELGMDAVTIRCGPLVQRIKYGEITALEETHSLWSAPALSLDRIAIRGRHGVITMVSVVEKREFMNGLARVIR